MPMKGSDLLVKALESEGVEYIFGIPGEENLDFLDALRRSSIRLVVRQRHEQAAGFMAATYGRLTGKTGVCMSTLGSRLPLRPGSQLTSCLSQNWGWVSRRARGGRCLWARKGNAFGL